MPLQPKIALHIISRIIPKYAETKLLDCCGPCKTSLKTISPVKSDGLGHASSMLDGPLDHANFHSNTLVEAAVEWSVPRYAIFPQNIRDALTVFVLPSATLIALKAADGFQ